MMMKNLSALLLFLLLFLSAQNIFPNTTYDGGAMPGVRFYSTDPPAFPASLTVCSIGNSTGNYNLTSVNETVNGNTGLTVLWWEDAAGTIPITDPANYTASAPSSVWATVVDGNCESDPVEVTLDIYFELNQSNTYMTAGDTTGCGSVLLSELKWSLPPGIYMASYSSINGTGATGNYYGPNYDCSIQLVILTEVEQWESWWIDFVTDQNGCVYTFPDQDTITFSLIPYPDLMVFQDPTVCQGGSIDLSTLASTTSGFPITFHSGSPATPANELPSPIVSPGMATTYYAFVSTPEGCSTIEPITVTIEMPATIMLGSGEVCNDITDFDLTTLVDPAYPDGVWSGPGVTGSNFDATGLNGQIQLTFTPDPSLCALPNNTFINVIQISTPILGTAQICSEDPPFSLSDLADPMFPNGTWSGQGVGGVLFYPFGLSGLVTITFTPSALCALPATTQIEVFSATTPILGADEICENHGSYDLGDLLDPQYQTGAGQVRA